MLFDVLSSLGVEVFKLMGMNWPRDRKAPTSAGASRSSASARSGAPKSSGRKEKLLLRSMPRSRGSVSSTTRTVIGRRPFFIAGDPLPQDWVDGSHVGHAPYLEGMERSCCLVPDHAAKRYWIEIHTNATAAEMAAAEQGTVRDGRLMHPMNPERSGIEISTIRGDYRDHDGVRRNRLRLWKKSDFVPRPDDIFWERLVADLMDHERKPRQGPAGNVLCRRYG